MMDHILIESDNLTALSILAATRGAFVDVHYLDPPYNTGDDGSDGGFVYNDKFVSSEDPTYHSTWLSFMLRRLVLLRETMRETGVIIVAIGDDEEAHLRLLMNEVFGEQNFISRVSWAGATGKNHANFVSNVNEYMHIYARNKSALIDLGVKWRSEKPGSAEIMNEANKIWLDIDSSDPFSTPEERAILATKKLRSWFKSMPSTSAVKRSAGNKLWQNIDSSGRVFASAPITAPGGGGGRYDVLHPTTKRPVVVPGNGWSPSESTMSRWIAEDRILFAKDHTTSIRRKLFLEETMGGVLRNVISTPRHHAAKEISLLLGKKTDGKPVFNNTKDTNVLAEWIDYVTPQFRKDESATDPIVICDVFAGSGSTGHAVFKLNDQDPAVQRRVILVTNNEDPTTKDDNPDTGVARDVTIKRLAAALTGKWADGKEHPTLPGNVHYYKTAWSHLLSSDPLHYAEVMESSYTGLVSLIEDAHHTLPAPDELAIHADKFDLLTDGTGKLVVVWKSTDSVILEEDLVLDIMAYLRNNRNDAKHVIYLPYNAEHFYAEDTGWDVVELPSSYVAKVRSVVKSKLLSAGLLAPFVAPTPQTEQLAATEEVDNTSLEAQSSYQGEDQ